MQPHYILNLETSSTVCSVSVTKDGISIFTKEENNGYTHAENLHEFIQLALTETELKAQDLSAVAVGTGPGSYTGLRIGMSTAKGLCYAIEKPLIAIPTLLSMTWRVKYMNKNNDFLFCPMIDARRMEVYTTTYNDQLQEVKPYAAAIIDEEYIRKLQLRQDTIFFGSGMNKCRQLLQRKEHTFFVDDILPSAQWMEALSFKKFQENDFEDLAYAEPFYGKEFYEGAGNKA